MAIWPEQSHKQDMMYRYLRFEKYVTDQNLLSVSVNIWEVCYELLYHNTTVSTCVTEKLIHVIM